MTSLLKERFFFSRSTVPNAQAIHNPVPFAIPSFRFLGLQDRAAHGTSNGRGILAELFSAVADASEMVNDSDTSTSSLFLGWRAARTVEGRAEHAAGGSCYIENSSQLYHSQDCRSIARRRSGIAPTPSVLCAARTEEVKTRLQLTDNRQWVYNSFRSLF
jgi:hypothetical protein